MEPISTLVISALGGALFKVGEQVSGQVLAAGVQPLDEQIKKRLQRGYQQQKAQVELRAIFLAAAKEAGVQRKDEDDALASYFTQFGLDRLADQHADALRQQFAVAVLGFTDPQAPPPPDLLTALRWPWSRSAALAALLHQLRAQLATSETWRPLLAYADAAAERGLLQSILAGLDRFSRALVQTPEGEALRVAWVERGLGEQEAAEIERRYRLGLQREFDWLDTRGLSLDRLLKTFRLPLAEVYLELGLLPLRSEKQREREEAALQASRDAERLALEQERQGQRLSGGLAQHQRLVMVGKPGSGKTISLKFIALMLARGAAGASGLRLDRPYLPLYVRLADYARQYSQDHGLALETFLLEYIQKHYPGAARQGELLQLALEQGGCLVLLDGLDEVGDLGENLRQGISLRQAVLEEVSRFARRRCPDAACNRLVVTSRLEGYRSGDLPGFAEVELSLLQIPGEVEDFLRRWFMAYEREYTPDLPPEAALRKAEEKVAALMSDILRSESVQRLAMNPLLLTILAMIHETGVRLPHLRVRVYDTVTRILIESWRQAQVGPLGGRAEVLPLSQVQRLLYSLAYWLHEHQMGGAMPLERWKEQLRRLLRQDDDEKPARQIEDEDEFFLPPAREQAGLLTERSPGQIGFFHLTLEEYLAAVEIARQGSSDQRRTLLKQHWQDPAWQEVILLTAGQLMIYNNDDGLASFINDLRLLEADDPALNGRGALLAGLALVDVGQENFKPKTRREVRQDLLETAQALDPETKRPLRQGGAPLLTRAAAADALDQLGYQPSDLHDFVAVPGMDAWIARYPVTNAQYARFLSAPDFAAERYWSGLPRIGEPPAYADLGGWGDEARRWLQANWDEVKKVYPRFWRDPRFGRARPAAPVVGISWWEANAYTRWLLAHWQELEEGQARPAPRLIRLPTEAEWAAAAGGGRAIPWSRPNDPLDTIEDILRRANIYESRIGRTTPVWMYPLGQSPCGVWDLAGNVWEWQANFYDQSRKMLALRGGSWNYGGSGVRASNRVRYFPSIQGYNTGFRCAFSP